MEALKNIYQKINYLQKNELKTLCKSNINNCNMCLKKCGSIIKLNQCKKYTKICFECLDILNDNYNIEKKRKNFLNVYVVIIIYTIILLFNFFINKKNDYFYLKV